MKHSDLIGKKFNKLTITSIVHCVEKKRWEAIVLCDCGNILNAPLWNLINGTKISCGCYRRPTRKRFPFNDPFKDELVLKRFYSFFVKSNKCWNWIGPIRSKVLPYGCFYYGYFFMQAHRYSYILHNGPIKDRLFVCHKCDNPRCVNPAHLFLGTPKDNTEDMVNKGRCARGEKHPKAKLSKGRVKKIRAEYAKGGTTHRKLAAKFNISQSVIYQVIHHIIWKHIK